MRFSSTPLPADWYLRRPVRAHPFQRRHMARLGLAATLALTLGVPLAAPPVGRAASEPTTLSEAARPLAPLGTFNPFELSGLDGTNGFVINGVAEGDNFGGAVGRAGDINGDGFDDILASAPGAAIGGTYGVGQTYLVFGHADPFTSSLGVATLDGDAGFALNGVAAYDGSGYAADGAGDVNGDGFDDLLIGAPRHDIGVDYDRQYNVGESYLVLGHADPFTPSVELAALDGTDGFRFTGTSDYDYVGAAVSGAGDVNGDGLADLLIGAYGADPNGDYSGQSYVIFGQADSFPATVIAADLDGTNGFALNGIAEDDESGAAVSDAGDVNGDGVDDIIIGAREASPGGRNSAGQSYVVFGQADAFAPAIELADLDGTDGFALNGVAATNRSGFSVSGAGDVNADGFADVIIGARGGGAAGAGESYVVFGHANPFSATVELADLDGTNGFTLTGIDDFDFSGWSVSGAGDVNQDGFSDLLVGAPQADPGDRINAGESYLVFGRSGAFPATLDLAELDGVNGIVFNGVEGNDRAGTAVSGTGDINDDGFDDLLVGAPQANSAIGETYLVFGDEFTQAPTALTLNTLSTQPAPTSALGAWLAGLLGTVALAWRRLRR